MAELVESHRQVKRAREPPPDVSPQPRERNYFSTDKAFKQYKMDRRKRKERVREFHRPTRTRDRSGRDQSGRSRPSRVRKQAKRREEAAAAEAAAAEAPEAAAAARVAEAATAREAPAAAPHPGPGWAWDDEYYCYYNVAEAEAMNAAEARMAAEVEQDFDLYVVRVARALLLCACPRDVCGLVRCVPGGRGARMAEGAD